MDMRLPVYGAVGDCGREAMRNRYRKKPVVIEAFRWTHDKVPKWWVEASADYKVDTSTMKVYIPTLEGTMIANSGDYIIKGVQGELYPCRPDIFEATYDAV